MSQGASVAGGVGLDFRARVAEAAETVGLVAGLGPAVIAERTADALGHHRASVLKAARADFPGGIRAQRYLSTRLHYYSRKRSPWPTTYAEATGEAFGAGLPGSPFGNDLELLERGGRRVSTKGPMVIPLAGFRGAGSRAPSPKQAEQVRQQAGQLAYDVTRSGALVSEIAGGKRSGRRTFLAGVLRRAVTIRPLLKFYPTFTRIEPRHAAKLERDLGRLVTEAGRQATRSRFANLERARALSAAEFARFLSLHPGDYKGARDAAVAIRKQILSDSLGDKKGGG